MNTPTIYAGDLVRALRELLPRDEATRAAIVRALGGELLASQAENRDPDEAIKLRPDSKPRKKTESAPLETKSDVTGNLREQQFKLQREKDKSVTAPMRLIAPQTAAPLPSSVPEDQLPPPNLEPLFNPQWGRAIVSTMARIQSRTGPPELEFLIEAVAERKPMFSLPTSIQESASGADILVDIGESMLMFGRDQDWLLDLISRVLGTGQVSVFRFAGCPTRGVRSGSAFDLQAYRPPMPGWPVILLTDLGIGAGIRAASAREWCLFADIIRAAGCHLIALVPYPASRWPAELSNAIDIVQWDRSTSVRTIRATIARPEGSSR